MPLTLLKLMDATLDILFPPLCLLCRSALTAAERQNLLCARCAARIPLADTLICGECHGRLPQNQAACHRDAPFRLAAATSYAREPVRELIWSLKYERHPAAARALGHLLAAHLARTALPWGGWLIVPIPLHRARLRARGFNQSLLIAETVRDRCGIPIAAGALARVRATKPQADLKDHGARRVNVAGCFTVRDAAAIKNRRILLVDDVTTSGATLREAAAALRAAGCRELIAAVAARAG